MMCVFGFGVHSQFYLFSRSQYYAGLVAAVVGWTVGYKQAFPAATMGFLPARVCEMNAMWSHFYHLFSTILPLSLSPRIFAYL